MALTARALILTDSSLAPKYWMHETSGVLALAVRKYLESPNKSTLAQLALLRMYFQQWVDSPVWDANPALDDESRADLERLRERCHGITNLADMKNWLREAVAMGMDPL